MSVHNFSIQPQVFSRFPHIQVAALRATLDDHTALSPLLEELHSEISAVAADLVQVEPITKLAQIAAWRDAYGKMSVKPSKFHSSVEALLRRAKKGRTFRPVCPP